MMILFKSIKSCEIEVKIYKEEGEMKKSLHSYSSLQYGKTVAWLDVILAVFWIGVFIYFFVMEDPYGVGETILFALHFVGLLALAATLDIHQDKQHKEKVPATTDVGDGDFEPDIRVRRSNTQKSSATYKCEEYLFENENHISSFNTSGDLYEPTMYPIAWGCALFISAISDLFSVLSVYLSHKTGGNTDNTGYILLLVLYSAGLVLDVFAFVWISIYYLVNKKS